MSRLSDGRVLVWNQASCSQCGGQSPCTCGKRVVSNGDGDGASKAAATASIQAGHTGAARHALRAVEYSNADEYPSAVNSHQLAARAHERAATQARMNDDEDEAEGHDNAAALHRKAASIHSAGLTSNAADDDLLISPVLNFRADPGLRYDVPGRANPNLPYDDNPIVGSTDTDLVYAPEGIAGHRGAPKVKKARPEGQGIKKKWKFNTDIEEVTDDGRGLSPVDMEDDDEASSEALLQARLELENFKRMNGIRQGWTDPVSGVQNGLIANVRYTEDTLPLPNSLAAIVAMNERDKAESRRKNELLTNRQQHTNRSNSGEYAYTDDCLPLPKMQW